MPQLRTNDRNAGLDTPHGRSYKPDRNGIITLPERDRAYADAAGKTGLFEPRRIGYAGFDADELRQRYEQWAQQHHQDG